MIREASDEGVTEIIGFVLIMGLVAVVLFIMALVSVSGNRFGVVEYRLIDTNITGPYSRPEIKININGREDAAKSLANLIGGTHQEENTWKITSYPGTVKVMTVNYSVVMQGAVP